MTTYRPTSPQGKHSTRRSLHSRASPNQKRVRVPARQAYSHSASVGSRYTSCSRPESLRQNAIASCQVTQKTGCSGPVENPSVLPKGPRGFLPITATYWLWVTSVTSM